MLLQMSQCFPLCPPPLSTSHSLRSSPHHCSCPWVMCINSLATPFPILYCTSPWPFCNYQFVLLNPLASSPIPPHSPPIWQPSKCSWCPWFCLCSCLLSLFFRFSCVERYVLIGILLYIVLIFFFLSKSFNISYNSGVVMMNSFSFFLSGKIFICLSILNDRSAG